jgi:hypothetical protein
LVLMPDRFYVRVFVYAWESPFLSWLGE